MFKKAWVGFALLGLIFSCKTVPDKTVGSSRVKGGGASPNQASYDCDLASDDTCKAIAIAGKAFGAMYLSETFASEPNKDILCKKLIVTPAYDGCVSGNHISVVAALVNNPNAKHSECSHLGPDRLFNLGTIYQLNGIQVNAVEIGDAPKKFTITGYPMDGIDEENIKISYLTMKNAEHISIVLGDEKYNYNIASPFFERRLIYGMPDSTYRFFKSRLDQFEDDGSDEHRGALIQNLAFEIMVENYMGRTGDGYETVNNVAISQCEVTNFPSYFSQTDIGNGYRTINFSLNDKMSSPYFYFKGDDIDTLPKLYKIEGTENKCLELSYRSVSALKNGGSFREGRDYAVINLNEKIACGDAGSVFNKSFCTKVSSSMDDRPIDMVCDNDSAGGGGGGGGGAISTCELQTTTGGGVYIYGDPIVKYMNKNGYYKHYKKNSIGDCGRPPYKQKPKSPSGGGGG